MCPGRGARERELHVNHSREEPTVFSTDISAPVVIEPVRRPTRLRRIGLVATGAGREAFPQLSGRELEVLDLLARGLENRRIARSLNREGRVAESAL